VVRRSSFTDGSLEGRIERFLKRGFVFLYMKYYFKPTKPQDEKELKEARERSEDYAVVDDDVLQTVQIQRAVEPYDVASEHIEILLQYGYVVMFTVAFPLAPVLAYLNNLWESRLDLFKIRVTRRPIPMFVNNIGGWFTALEVMSFIAVLTNCLLLVSGDKAILDDYVPRFMEGMLDSDIGRILLALIVEHFLLGFKFILSAAIDDVPESVQEELKVRRREEEEVGWWWW